MNKTENKKFKIGVFGAWRGESFIPIFESFDEFEVTAVCDKNAERIQKALGALGSQAEAFTDF